jgi:hypothetical protein
MGNWIWTVKSTVPEDALKKPLTEQWIFSVKNKPEKSAKKKN